MFTGKQIKNKTPEAHFPKLMISDDNVSKPYLAVVLFEKPLEGMCLEAHDASSLTAGHIYKSLDMDCFYDYQGTFEVRNTYI